MTELVKALEPYYIVFIAVLFVLCVCQQLCCSKQKKELKALKEKYEYFTQGDDKNWDQVMTDTLAEVRELRCELRRVRKDEEELREKLKTCVHNVRLVRYNAFNDVGSDQSYSLALTDENNDGVVLTSIYGRDDNRTYAKPVVGGKSKYLLSEEEVQVLNPKKEG